MVSIIQYMRKYPFTILWVIIINSTVERAVRFIVLFVNAAEKISAFQLRNKEFTFRDKTINFPFCSFL